MTSPMRAPMSFLMSRYNNIISPLRQQYLSVGKPNIYRPSEYELSCKLASILVALHGTFSMLCWSTVKYGPQMALPHSIIWSYQRFVKSNKHLIVSKVKTFVNNS